MSQNQQQTSLPVAPARRRRRGWRIAGLVALSLVLFVTGGITGAGAAALFIRRQVLMGIRHPERNPVRLARLLARRLDLNEQQHQQVKQILLRRQQDMLQIRREAMPKVRAQLSLVDQEVRQVLRPDQQQKWAELVEDFRNRWLPPVPPAATEPEGKDG